MNAMDRLATIMFYINAVFIQVSYLRVSSLAIILYRHQQIIDWIMFCEIPYHNVLRQQRDAINSLIHCGNPN